MSAPNATGGGSVYVGRVAHTRLRPFRHRFAYRVFTLLLDLDALPALDHGLHLFAYNRAGLFSFHDSDHGPRDGSPLRPWIDAQLAEAGIDLDGGRVRLLCFPRVLGYVFNPLTVWFCHGPDDALRAIFYEVANTRGERHGYHVPFAAPVPAPIGGAMRTAAPSHRAEKCFYVSPFIAIDGRYRFHLRGPGERLDMTIRHEIAAGPQLVATLSTARRRLDDPTLARLFLSHPVLTQKVMGAIHWEALKLWLKGAKIHPHTPRGPAIRTSAGAVPHRQTVR
ncbi:MAG: DUF1365 domain-containing protein [Alphaproteobacteria bacterium]